MYVSGMYVCMYLFIVVVNHWASLCVLLQYLVDVQVLPLEGDGCPDAHGDEAWLRVFKLRAALRL